MSAHDDYPPPHNAGGSAHEQHDTMCDEIDKLRTLTDDLAGVLSVIVVGWELDNDLPGKLSDHPEVKRVFERYRESKKEQQ